MKGIILSIFLLGAALATQPAEARQNKALDAQEKQKATTFLPRRYQTANVFDAAAGPGTRLGAAWLIRSRNGIQGRIMTNVPTAGDPYTLWFVLFNKPSECVDGCDASDLANPDVQGSVYNASGAISSANGLGTGTVNIDFEIVPRNVPNGLFILAGDRRGLRRNRGFKSEVHLVVDQHPPIAIGQDSWISDLTTTNFPGMGSANSIAAAVFVACRDYFCPESVL